MNSDTSLAAWLIAGGPRTIDPSDARNIAHQRELAAGRAAPAGASVAERLSAAIDAWRSPRVADPACCTV